VRLPVPNPAPGVASIVAPDVLFRARARRIDMDLTEQLLLFIVSLVANLFSAFAGGGAGLLQFPALIFLGLPFGVALATHKVASVALGVGVTLIGQAHV